MYESSYKMVRPSLLSWFWRKQHECRNLPASSCTGLPVAQRNELNTNSGLRAVRRYNHDHDEDDKGKIMFN